VRHLLLDTHVVLWAFSEPSRLSASVRDAIADPRNVVMVSSATVWEVAIKRAIGKLEAPAGFAQECTDRGFDALDITFAHAEAAAALPSIHADPFDRMLAAQAAVEGLELVSADSVFERYGLRVVRP
jgi:PIN domain nuclease of toxin-antitoxin system